MWAIPRLTPPEAGIGQLVVAQIGWRAVDNAQQEIDRELVALCVVECARDLLKVQRCAEPLDLDIDLTEGDSLPFSDYVMDSLGFVQWMAELEAQLEVPVMGAADFEEVRTLGGLADAIVRDASSERLRSFCDRWSTAPSPPGL